MGMTGAGRSGIRNRRGVLVSLGAGVATALAGCTRVGTGSGPTYEDGDVGDVDGENRTAEEMAVAEALAQRAASDQVTSLEPLELRDHEFVVADGYVGASVRGTVENTGEDRVETVEVRVRVYDGAGNQLGRYLASTGDLAGEGTWRFTVIVLEAPGGVGHYDVAVLGTPS